LRKQRAGKAVKTGILTIAALIPFIAIAQQENKAWPSSLAQHDMPARPPPIPADIANRNARLQGLLQPSAKSWVDTQARTESQRPAPDLAALETAIRARFGSTAGGSSGIPPGADIEELAFVVLMNATNDQDSDLQQIMNEVQAQTKAKQFLREQMQIVNKDVANNSRQLTSEASKTCNSPGCNELIEHASDIAAATVQSKKPVHIGGAITYGQLKEIQEELQGSLDSMNEMSETTSMRLQMAMDRRSKFVEALSNVMKKIDSTQEAIIQNLK
jgi:flagellar hook-basal body complex protein FliE